MQAKKQQLSKQLLCLNDRHINRRQTRTLATTVSGLPLDFWSESVGDIAVYYSLTDPDNPNTMFRITIYPKKI